MATTDPLVFEALKRTIKLMHQAYEAKRYVDGALERCHPPLLSSEEGLYEFLLYFCGALSAYGKCFVSATGSRRLSDEEIFNHDENLMRSHERIMALRHKFVAHSDKNEIDSVSIQIDERADNIHLTMMYELSVPYDRLYELELLITRLTEFIVDEQAHQVERIVKRLGKPVTIGPRSAEP